MSKELFFRLAKALAAFALWLGAYLSIAPLARWLTYGLFGFGQESPLGHAVEFFLYDTPKILLLLVLMVYAIGWMRAGLDTDRVREYLKGKGRGIGYALGALFGAVTPFCSCSRTHSYSFARSPYWVPFSLSGWPSSLVLYQSSSGISN